MRAMGSNALASYIVLACRPRSENAPQTDRRGFMAELKRELPEAIKRLQQGNIAPVDLAQAAIGPGMAVFSRYSQVLEPDGRKMTVRTALALINQVLTEVWRNRRTNSTTRPAGPSPGTSSTASTRGSSARPSSCPRPR